MTRFYGSTQQRRHKILDASGIGEARRDALRLCHSLGADEVLSGRLALVVTELATNLVRHGTGGEILLQAIPAEVGHLLEVISLDRGPGIRDVARSLHDGFSTGGTAGTGLGAVKRLSREFDVYSAAGSGTVVLARLGAAVQTAFGAVCIPLAGETSCGDAWCLATEDGAHWSLVVVDGLGHGSLAAEAAVCALGRFTDAPGDTPQAQLERAHRALSGTRGAAVAYAQRSDGVMLYAGVGNIAGRLTAATGSHGLVSHNGTLGFQMPRVQQFDYRVPADSLLIMHSDGLSARWDLQGYAGLRGHHPGVIAALLYRDFGRARDDATVVVIPA
jgi:anti-sigma regulatory factor (Ser/Thr protein kinase)